MKDWKEYEKKKKKKKKEEKLKKKHYIGQLKLEELELYTILFMEETQRKVFLCESRKPRPLKFGLYLHLVLVLGEWPCPGVTCFTYRVKLNKSSCVKLEGPGFW